ncbi:nucleotide exchange factor GrpE [Candidatus Falkowbacteria bacterium]|nr:nucleotide exchange factor GrpE [Candidatus Falkowbacteria bacterium]
MTDEEDKKQDEETADDSQPAPVSAENELEELKKKCDEYLNGWKRAQADYQNLVKETAKQRLEFVKYANENLILELLPILDNFEAAFSQIPETEQTSATVVGFSHIKKQLEDFLKENGVERIKTIGEKFDPMSHEAVLKDVEAAAETEIKIDESAEQIIVKEIRPGYRLNKKVVQAAKVVVSFEHEQNERDK